MKLADSNPDMSLAQLAKAWNVPIEGDNAKVMSSVNIKALCTALSQKTGGDASTPGKRPAAVMYCIKVIRTCLFEQLKLTLKITHSFLL